MKAHISLRKVDKICIWFFTITYPLLCAGELFLFQWLPQWAWFQFISNRRSDLTMHESDQLQRLVDFYKKMIVLQGPAFYRVNLLITAIVVLFVFYLLLARPRLPVAMLAFGLPFLFSRLLLFLIRAMPTGIRSGFFDGLWYIYTIEMFPYGEYRIPKILAWGFLLYLFERLVLRLAGKKTAAGPQ